MRIPPPARDHRGAWLAGGLAATAAAGAWIAQVNLPGLFGWELAFTGTRAARHLARWAADPDVGPVAANVRRDYVFLAVYWVPFSAAAGWAAKHHGRAGTAWLPVYAVACDAVENAFLLREVAVYGRDGTVPSYLAAGAGVAAAAKFLLLAVTLGYVAAGAVTAARRRRPRAPRPSPRSGR
jgi:hypothetical protein